MQSFVLISISWKFTAIYVQFIFIAVDLCYNNETAAITFYCTENSAKKSKWCTEEKNKV